MKRHANRRARGWAEGRSRTLCLFIAVLRVLVVLVSVQTTSVLHIVADVVDQLSDGTVHEENDCGDDDEGTECPPGCPSCHSTHGMMASLPVPPGVPWTMTPHESDETRGWGDSLAPPKGASSSVFHPPRVADRLSKTGPTLARA